MNTWYRELGILLVGHGTSSDRGTQQFVDLSEHFARRVAPARVERAFLEIQQPSIAESIDRLLQAGVQKLVVMPLLLFAAGHAKRDIPDAVSAALQIYGRPDLPWVQAAHLGCHPAIVELSHRRLAQSIADQPHISDTDATRSNIRVEINSCLLIVGRGSNDDSATTQMQEFARLRQQQEGGLRTEVAFLAMAQPLLGEQLRQLAAANYTANYNRVMVQPHLLFEGELADSLRRQVASIASAHPKTDWVVTPLLADALVERGIGTELLADAMVDRCLEWASFDVRVARSGSGS